MGLNEQRAISILNPPDDMFAPYPPAPWRVTTVHETKNKAFIWTSARGYLKDVCVAEVHAQYLGQLETLARLVSVAPELLQLLRESQDNIGGDWRARRDAVLNYVNA